MPAYPTAWSLSEAVSDAFPGHYGGTVIGRISRKLASSWSQAGLLSGCSRKVRAQTVAKPTNTVYALYLGQLCGPAGDTLFSTIWARMLGRPVSELRALAGVAARQDWLEYRQSGAAPSTSIDDLSPVNYERTRQASVDAA